MMVSVWSHRGAIEEKTGCDVAWHRKVIAKYCWIVPDAVTDAADALAQ